MEFLTKLIKKSKFFLKTLPLAFSIRLSLSAANPTEHANTALPSVTSKRKTRRRNAALFNPETILEEHGEDTLLDSLNKLEVDQLKDIVSEFGMDPAKKVMKWKKKDRFVAHIVEVTNHRLQKGGAFRRIN